MYRAGVQPVADVEPDQAAARADIGFPFHFASEGCIDGHSADQPGML